MDLQFKKLNINDKPLFDEFFAARKTLISVNDFATVFNWDTKDMVEYAVAGDALIIANVFKGTRVYYCPVLKSGHDITPYVDAITRHENGRSHIIAQLTQGEADALNGIKGYDLIADRDYSDYIYNSADLINLTGRKFHSKRNFINRFTAKYTYNLRPYTTADYAACMELYDKWLDASGDEEENHDKLAIIRALNNYEVLKLQGSVLEIDGKIVAFEIFSIDKVNSVAHIHFEKADIDYEGVFPAIVNLTAKEFLSGVEFINRQEDMGIEGLRKSKLSYNPAFILNKYRLKTQY